MQLLKEYTGIDETIYFLKLQIIDSLDYALKTTPNFENPRQLFEWLKPKLIYKNDFANTELLQSMPTLFKNNCHGTPGAGDCDCFTITTVACMIAQDWNNININLVGRQKTHPVHIYTDIIWKGQRQVLDFTNKKFNQERPYPYRQRIAVDWRNW